MSSTATQRKSKSKVEIEEPTLSRDKSLIVDVGQRATSLSRLRLRRKSYGFSGVASVGGQQRRQSSQIGLEFKRPPILFLNTYQLEPHDKFHVVNVTKAIDSILDAYYEEDSTYSTTDSPSKTMFIADQVMRAVKDMNFNRFRIISVVTVAQKRAQCYNNAVAFLWDHEFDSIVNIQREYYTSIIQVTCFGVYLD